MFKKLMSYILLIFLLTGIMPAGYVSAAVNINDNNFYNMPSARPAMASDWLNNDINYAPQNAFDGDRTTGWARRGDYEVLETASWLQIDMGMSAEVVRLIVFANRGAAYSPGQLEYFEIYFSDDKDFNTGVTLYAINSNPIGENSSFTKEATAAGRYIRIVSGIGKNLAIAEVRFYQYRRNIRSNLALNKPILASSTLQNENPARLINDGSTLTYWASDANDSKQWCQIDLGRPIDFSVVGVVALPIGNNEHQTVNFRVLASNKKDFSSGGTLLGEKSGDPPSPGEMSVFANGASLFRYVRIEASSPGQTLTVSEIYTFRGWEGSEVAAGKPSSSPTANDGDMYSLWTGSTGSVVNIDLQDTYAIKTVELLDTDFGGIEILASNNESFNKGVVTLAKYNKQYSGCWIGNVADVTPYRYIQISALNSTISVGDVRVYGTRLSSKTNLFNVAYKKPLSFNEGNASDASLVYANDSIYSTKWSNNSANSFQLDLLDNYPIKKMAFVDLEDCDVFLSSNKNFTECTQISAIESFNSSALKLTEVIFDQPITAQYVRAVKKDGYTGIVLGEIVVYAEMSYTEDDIFTNLIPYGCITATDTYAGLSPENAIDANVSTYWSNNRVSSDSSLILDLGAVKDVGIIEFTSAPGINADIRKNFKISSATSEDFGDEQVLMILGNIAMAQREVLRIFLNEKPMRYIRLSSVQGNTSIAATEIVALTKFKNFTPNVPTDVSSGKKTYVSGSSSTTVGSNANDGDANTYWTSDTRSTPPYWQVDLGTGYVLNNVKIEARKATGSSIAFARVLASNDSSFHDYTIIGVVGSSGYTTANPWSLAIESKEQFRFLRVERTEGSGAIEFAEFRAYGVTPVSVHGLSFVNSMIGGGNAVNSFAPGAPLGIKASLYNAGITTKTGQAIICTNDANGQITQLAISKLIPIVTDRIQEVYTGINSVNYQPTAFIVNNVKSLVPLAVPKTFTSGNMDEKKRTINSGYSSGNFSNTAVVVNHDTYEAMIIGNLQNGYKLNVLGAILIGGKTPNDISEEFNNVLYTVAGDTCDDNGNFNIKFKVDRHSPQRDFNAYLNYEGSADQPIKVSFSFLNQADMNQMMSQLKSESSAGGLMDAVLQLNDDHKIILNLSEDYVTFENVFADEFFKEFKLNIARINTVNDLEIIFKETLIKLIINTLTSDADDRIAEYIDVIDSKFAEDYYDVSSSVLANMINYRNSKGNFDKFSDLEKQLKDFIVLSLVNSADFDNAEHIISRYGSLYGVSDKYENADKYQVHKAIIDKDFPNVSSFVTTLNNRIKELTENIKNMPQQPNSPSDKGGIKVVGSSVPTFVIPDDIEKATVIDSPLEFSDVARTYWAYESIKKLADRDIISKSDDNMFNPEKNVTREEFIKMLVVAFGLISESEVKFADVQRDEWYYQYVCAGVHNEIINGIDDKYFGIGQEIIRQDAATMIYRYLKKTDVTNPDTSNLDFKDSGAIDKYAKEAVGYLAGKGIVNGMDDNSFAPKASLTRAQASKILYEVIR